MGSVIPSNTIDNWPIKALLPDILKPTAADFHLLYSRSTLGCLPFSNHEPILKKFSSLFTWVGTLHVYNNHMEGFVLGPMSVFRSGFGEMLEEIHQGLG